MNLAVNVMWKNIVISVHALVNFNVKCDIITDDCSKCIQETTTAQHND